VRIYFVNNPKDYQGLRTTNYKETHYMYIFYILMDKDTNNNNNNIETATRMIFFLMCCLMLKIVWINKRIKGILLRRRYGITSEIWKGDKMFKPRYLNGMFFSHVCLYCALFGILNCTQTGHTQVFLSTGKVSLKHNLTAALQIKSKTRHLSS